MKMFKSSFFAFMLVALAIFMSGIAYADISQTSDDVVFGVTVDNDVGIDIAAGMVAGIFVLDDIDYRACNSKGLIESIIYESPPPSELIAINRIDYKESKIGSFVNEIDASREIRLASRDRPSVVIRI